MLHVGYQSSVTKQASKEKHEPSLQGNLRTGSPFNIDSNALLAVNGLCVRRFNFSLTPQAGCRTSKGNPVRGEDKWLW